MLKSELVFGYGSNMDPSQMRERCPQSDLAWFIAQAQDRALWFPRKSIKRKGGVGSLKASDGDVVWGVVFSVSERDLDRLDRSEGVPDSYKRDPIEVTKQDGSRHTVWTYVAVPADTPPKDYTPHRDYIKLYIQGAEYFGLPAAYTEKLRKIETKNIAE
jgi:cation transport regulator ChaC